MPQHRKVNDKVTVTEQSFQNIVNGSKSIHAYPCSSFVEKIRKHIGKVGVITHTFLPGYEATVNFNGESFHMKDHWIESHA